MLSRPFSVTPKIQNRSSAIFDEKAILRMPGQIFMRVDEVAEELGVSKPYAYKLIKRILHVLRQAAWNPAPFSETLPDLNGKSTCIMDKQKRLCQQYCCRQSRYFG